MEKSQLQSNQNPTSVVPSLSPALVSSPQVLISRYEPVAARIIGGGTSCVLAGDSVWGQLPEGAVLVAYDGRGTSTTLV
jgi:hypothetical protein